jgi:DNA-binding NtrC family response regulator
VRELRNVMERAAVLSAESDMVDVQHLLLQQRTNRSALGSTSSEGRAGDIAIPPEGKTLAAIEREAASITLQLAGGNRTHAARMLGISRPTLARILREPGLDAQPE